MNLRARFDQMKESYRVDSRPFVRERLAVRLNAFDQTKESYRMDSRLFVFGRAFCRATERVLEVARLVAQLDTSSVVACSSAANPMIDLS
ncbi:hypothetical protein Bca101_020219 [Brassica carinata]